MRAALLIVLTLAACATPAPELQPFELAAAAAARRAWDEAGLPAPTQGKCDVSRFYVRFAACTNPPSASYGCLGWRDTDNWFGWKEYPVVTIAPWWHSEPTIIIHELCHALSKCAGLGLDPMHSNLRIWESLGKTDSVQSRAKSMVAQ